jgi:hypothetical protein
MLELNSLLNEIKIMLIAARQPPFTPLKGFGNDEINGTPLPPFRVARIYEG